MEFDYVLVSALIFGGLMCLVLFKFGQWMRRGIELRKHIDGERVWAIAIKKAYDQAKYRQLRRLVRFLIGGPLLALCVLYIMIAIQWGLTALLFSLLSLVIVGLGCSRYKVKEKMPSVL